jgi:hypothetical protein
MQVWISTQFGVISKRLVDESVGFIRGIFDLAESAILRAQRSLAAM